MTVSTFTQPDHSSDTGTDYKTAIDGAIHVMQRIAASFAPHQQTTADMTVRIDSGALLNGTTLTEVAAQSTSTIIAPVTNPRIDRVVVNSTTGVVSVIAGSEAASPTAPAITTGTNPLAQIALTVAQTEIANADITDERVPPSIDLSNIAITGGTITGITQLEVDGTASAAASLVLAEDTDNGTNNITIQAPSAIASDKVFSLPDTTGTAALTSQLASTATTSAEGLVELGTATEVKAGTDTSRVSPISAIGDHLGVADAWLNMNGQGTIAIRDDHNISSITDYGTGQYGATFTNNMPNVNYSVTSGIGFAGATVSPILGLHASDRTTEQAPSVSAFRWYTSDWNGAASDFKYINMHVYSN